MVAADATLPTALRIAWPYKARHDCCKTQVKYEVCAMLANLIVTVLLLSTSLTAHANQRREFDLNAMANFLERTKGIETLPQRNTQAIEEASGDVPLPKEISDFFELALKQIFQNPLGIVLKTCGSEQCIGLAEYGIKTIYLNPKYFKNLEVKYGNEASLLTKFIVLHEISHFIHELSVEGGRTINGHTSHYETDPDLKTNSKMWREVFLSHNEVDAYALLLLKKLNFKKPLVLLKWFDDEIKEAKQAEKSDFYEHIIESSVLRAEDGKRVMDQLWD